jgi:hypothetical protein
MYHPIVSFLVNQISGMLLQVLHLPTFVLLGQWMDFNGDCMMAQLIIKMMTRVAYLFGCDCSSLLMLIFVVGHGSWRQVHFLCFLGDRPHNPAEWICETLSHSY